MESSRARGLLLTPQQEARLELLSEEIRTRAREMELDPDNLPVPEGELPQSWFPSDPESEDSEILDVRPGPQTFTSWRTVAGDIWGTTSSTSTTKQDCPSPKPKQPTSRFPDGNLEALRIHMHSIFIDHFGYLLENNPYLLHAEAKRYISWRTHALFKLDFEAFDHRPVLLAVIKHGYTRLATLQARITTLLAPFLSQVRPETSIRELVPRHEATGKRLPLGELPVLDALWEGMASPRLLRRRILDLMVGLRRREVVVERMLGLVRGNVDRIMGNIDRRDGLVGGAGQGCVGRDAGEAEVVSHGFERDDSFAAALHA
ncbi:hypothetical protein LTR62_000723 [Meristemomyces frigidus]|uniref:Uncharacterized protein n=1 Tax=Meristemomyces frigidus TaxID=1508187 RepID=A0AAN7TA06_9PEZI|nr:hypothetical protein LTR62_000723 [Meristemomyces frigidus]